MSRTDTQDKISNLETRIKLLDLQAAEAKRLRRPIVCANKEKEARALRKEVAKLMRQISGLSAA